MCHYRLRQTTIACLNYRNEKVFWPSIESWNDSTKPYLEFEGAFRCPNDKTSPCSYAINKNIPANANELPGDLVILFESTPGWNQAGGADDVVTDRHGKPGANIAFADGHVEFIKSEDIPTLRWTMEE